MRTVALTVSLLFTVAVFAHLAQTPSADLVKEVRAAIAGKDFAAGDRLLADARKAGGVTPQWLAALSWMGRGALADKRLDEAERYARQAYTEANAFRKRTPLGSDPNAPLPIALGAAIEVLAQVEVQRDARSGAVGFLQQELATHKGSSIEKRLQKNLNMLTLEGSAAPALDLSESIGVQPTSLAELKGKPVLLFFWAHWCADCKALGPMLTTLAEKYDSQNLVLVAPTQRYGYVAAGKDASPAEERQYIEQLQKTTYPALTGKSMPLSEANHRRYGVSSTPTIVLVDRTGIVRLYHPGKITPEALEAAVRKVL